MTVKTIDERIRSTARAELNRVLDSALRDFCKAIEILGTADEIKVNVLDDKDLPVEARAYNMDILKEIKEEAFKKLSAKYEEMAISEFMGKVDHLSNQINELHNQFSD